MGVNAALNPKIRPLFATNN